MLRLWLIINIKTNLKSTVFLLDDFKSSFETHFTLYFSHLTIKKTCNLLTYTIVTNVSKILDLKKNLVYAFFMYFFFT